MLKRLGAKLCVILLTFFGFGALASGGAGGLLALLLWAGAVFFAVVAHRLDKADEDSAKEAVLRREARIAGEEHARAQSLADEAYRRRVRIEAEERARANAMYAGSSRAEAAPMVREKLVERQVVVKECRYCGKYTPADLSKCRECGSPGIS